MLLWYRVHYQYHVQGRMDNPLAYTCRVTNCYISLFILPFAMGVKQGNVVNTMNSYSSKYIQIFAGGVQCTWYCFGFTKL